jgi:hypothetical protein
MYGTVLRQAFDQISFTEKGGPNPRVLCFEAEIKLYR